MMPRETDRIADPPATAPTAWALFGRDFEPPAAVGTAVLATGAVALGIARGWRRKPYAYVDANEDAVAGVVGARAQLLVVADGHGGRQASHAAVAAALDILGGDPRPADLSDGEMIDTAVRIEGRIGGDEAGPGPRSRTTMVVALRTRTQLQWFGAGDSALLFVDDERRGALPVTTRWFFGDGLDGAAMRPRLARGRTGMPASAWVCLVTDGYSDYLPDSASAPASAAAEATLQAGTAHRAVGALLDQARRGGAGDNVGVVVSGPWYKPDDGHDHVLDHHG